MIFAEFIDALHPVTERLRALGIDHYIGGSVASSTYGAVRATNDVDIATRLAKPDIRPFLRGFEQEFYFDEAAAEDAATSHRSFNLVHFGTAIKIDVFCPTLTPFQLEAFLRATPRALDPRRPHQSFTIATAEDVILTKLRWYDLGGRTSDQQMRDVAGIVRVAKDLDVDYMRRWAPSLGISDVLESLFST